MSALEIFFLPLTGASGSTNVLLSQVPLGLVPSLAEFGENPLAALYARAGPMHFVWG